VWEFYPYLALNEPMILPPLSPSPILIVGGGLAGLFTALKLAPQPCVVLTPRALGEGASSTWAQGGIAAALEEGDTPEQHARDTIMAGAGLVDADVALHMAQEARDRVMDLLKLGVPFDRDAVGQFMQSKEAAHSARRIVRVSGDKAGRAIMDALIKEARIASHITLLEGYIAEEAHVVDQRVVGIWARQITSRERIFLQAQATILATGGIGALYAITTNPLEAQGLGVALAARAGARIADPEFVQFHPTAMNIGLDPAPLATEALRGEGAGSSPILLLSPQKPCAAKGLCSSMIRVIVLCVICILMRNLPRVILLRVVFFQPFKQGAALILMPDKH
jgi:L-aspartate oxidase